MGLIVLFAALLSAAPLTTLQYRWVGPAVMGGRLDAVAGIPGDPKIIYLGHSSGGLWKSVDGGLTFTSTFEDGSSSAIGAIAIDPRDPNRVYVGTGEGFPRNTAAYGDGVWGSNDAGKTWRRLGLPDSGSIAKIAVDPFDSRVILAAAMGHEFAPSQERGIFRSDDRGRTWKRVLFVNDTTGGSDIAFDPKRHGVVYAGTFDYLRRPWTLRSGGPGSGLYVSRDAGRTWKRLTDPALRNGLPPGPINRVGVSVCASNPAYVYAFVPVKNGMLYRSTDYGAHWTLRNASQEINFRPFYFSQVRCDPNDPERVYAVAGGLLVSRDGGAHFRDAGGGGDNHDLWIDPRDSNRLLNGSDMGFDLSLDGGKTWNYDDVVPFAQVYRAGYDYDVPYHVMGGLQDHEVWWGPNEKPRLQDGVGNGDWLNISDWGDGQYAMADPRDPNVVYEDTHFGDLVRANLATGQRRYISPQPSIGFGTGAGTYRYRFNWSAPLLISHFDPDTIFFGANVLFRSTDRGEHWSEFSPDLTHCSPGQLGPSGGPITHDNTNAESYCTIYTITEDAKDPRTVWYGTDNGHIDLTRDGGATWTDVIGRVPRLPLPARVAALSASPTRSGTVYASFDRHEWNDYRAYAYVTRDFGRTWSALGSGLQSYVHVVREDPKNASVLYAGTETGAFVSFDGGANWSDLRLGLPHLPVFDLQVHPRDNDLIVATHARGFYILDDLTPLQQWSKADGKAAYLFAPMPAIRFEPMFYHEHGRGAFVSENKPSGALLTLYLAHAPPAPPKSKPMIRVHILDASRAEIAAFEVPVKDGFNRFNWDLSTLPPGGSRAAQDKRYYYIFYPMKIVGPDALPGTYTAVADAPGGAVSAPVTVVDDPKHPADPAALRAQFEALRSLAALQERAEAAIAALESFGKRAPEKRAAADALLARLRNPEPSGYRQPARLSEQLAYLRYTVSQSLGAPTAAQQASARAYASELDAVEAQVRELGAGISGSR